MTGQETTVPCETMSHETEKGLVLSQGIRKYGAVQDSFMVDRNGLGIGTLTIRLRLTLT
jgi:hypothetical protein